MYFTTFHDVIFVCGIKQKTRATFRKNSVFVEDSEQIYVYSDTCIRG